jgi:hypothetical protein
MSYEVTETKYEWQLSDYLVRTYVGEYGIHTEWFKGDNVLDSDDVPDTIMAEYEKLCQDEGL